MICPMCKNEINDKEQICPICHNFIPITYSKENKQKEIKKINCFMIVFIIIGLLVFLFLLFLNLEKKESKPVITTETTTKEIISNNKGRKSNYNFPFKVGDITLASFYDEENNSFSEVDIKGVRFLSTEEASTLAINNNYSLIDGFSWYGFVYQIYFNDLNYLNGKKISPIINAHGYQYGGSSVVTYEGHNYPLNVITLTKDVLITNNESAEITVIYQKPYIKEFSLCFGYRDKYLGCFTE